LLLRENNWTAVGAGLPAHRVLLTSAGQQGISLPPLQL